MELAKSYGQASLGIVGRPVLLVNHPAIWWWGNTAGCAEFFQYAGFDRL